MGHQDRLRTGYGKKKVGFYKDGALIETRFYEIGSKEMWTEMKEYESVAGQSTRFLN